MWGKISVRKIISDHIDTFRDDATGKRSVGDFFLFFGIPLIVAVGLRTLGVSLDKGTVSLLVTSLSIFAALLFNLLLLVFDIVRKEPSAGQRPGPRAILLHQVYANISFSILVALLSVVALLTTYFDSPQPALRHILNGASYFLSTLFLLTILMVLKRIHSLLSKEI